MMEEHIIVGVVGEKRKAQSIWIDHTWGVASVLLGAPQTPPGTLVGREEGVERFFLGTTGILLTSSATMHYRDNLMSGAPKLWVILREHAEDGSISLVGVTADPSEGEGHTQAGSDLVEALPMHPEIAAAIAAFVDEHHVERAFFKRKRDRADPDALAHRRKHDSGFLGRRGDE
jgi:hypothetical protein